MTAGPRAFKEKCTKPDFWDDLPRSQADLLMESEFKMEVVLILNM